MIERKCKGCGAILQDQNKEEKGFIPNLTTESKYCKRFFRMMHYNELPKIVASNKEYEHVIDDVIKKNGLIVFVVDIFAFKATFNKKMIDKLREKNVILVANKYDVFPHSTNVESIVSWLSHECEKVFFKVDAIHIVSSKKGYFIEDLTRTIDLARKERDVYFVGCANVGKSSLINQTLYPYLKAHLNKETVLDDILVKDIKGLENIDKVVDITQEPIGRTPRSNPATYVKLFDDIRDIFSSTVEAKARGYDKGRFSFNVVGGRCERCWGDGVVRIPMNFLPDVYVKCDVCDGKRYNEETLQVTYKGKNIYDVLEMTVEEALHFFENRPSLKKKLQLLCDVGLGYIKLGQQATTLSGGEAQRIKLALYLQRKPTGKTLYILDEPTTGLHSEDVSHLLKVLQSIVEHGDTVLVIEHNLDVIKVSDYIIDLGPEGGDNGGTVVALGTPEEIVKNEKSYTGQYLKGVLKEEHYI